MHELSVARNLVELIQREIRSGELPFVRTVSIRIGDLAGIVPESLEFCYKVVTDESPLAGSHLCFERIPFVVYCDHCRRSSHNPDGSMFCSHCSNAASSIVMGNELELTNIDVATPEEEHAWQRSP
ncbi:MAG: hydrogenase maturation nickel metallochaperone HypA [Bacteroidota bacterium]